MENAQIKWRDKCGSPDELIREISSLISIGSNGRAGYALRAEFLFDSLFDKIIHSYTLDKEFLYNIFVSSLTKTLGENKNAKANTILKQFSKDCKKKIEKKNKYILTTSINIKKSYKLKRKLINGCVITFRKVLPKKLGSARANLICSNEELDEQKDYLFVTISVEAPDVYTAFMKAIGALDVVRAILQIGFKKSLNILAGNRSAMHSSHAVVKLGPAHTLHFESGAEASEIFWYEKDFKNTPPITITRFEHTESYLTETLKKINRNSFKDHILDSLSRYITSLDKIDQEFRFLKLWSTLEKLINSDETAIIIKRVSFLYKNRELQRDILETLRSCRNINVHSGVTPCNVELKNYQMCIFIENLMKFFINNPFKYKNLSDVIKFMSSPAQQETIDEQIRNLRIVKKFIGS